MTSSAARSPEHDTTTVERVARAIYEAQGMRGRISWAYQSEPCREAHRTMARAALVAAEPEQDTTALASTATPGENPGTAPDEWCRRCRGVNVVWQAPSPLWNLVMRGNDILAEASYGDLVCMPCFVILAAEAGVEGRWRLTIDPEPDGLIYETPSGRVWDADRWLWVAPAEAGRATADTDPPRPRVTFDLVQNVGQPSECSVYVDGVQVFSGIDRSAVLARRASGDHQVERPDAGGRWKPTPGTDVHFKRSMPILPGDPIEGGTVGTVVSHEPERDGHLNANHVMVEVPSRDLRVMTDPCFLMPAGTAGVQPEPERRRQIDAAVLSDNWGPPERPTDEQETN